MTIVNDVDAVVEWLESEVCPKVALKRPANVEQSGGYGYELVRPSAFAMFLPGGKDRLPPGAVTEHPSVLVQLVSGEDRPASCDRAIKLRFHLSAWDPGIHGQDVLNPTRLPDGTLVYAQGGEGGLRRSEDGWHDAWSFLDVLVASLRSTAVIGGVLSLDRSRPVSFGMYEEQGAIVDYYPFFFAWAEADFVESAPASPFLAEYL